MSTTSNIEILKVQITDSISKVISVIQQSGPFACALLYENDHFLNIVTDGDVRRAILSGCRIEEKAQVLNSVKSKTSRPKPIVANVDSSQEFIFC